MSEELTPPGVPVTLYTYAMSPFSAKVHACLLYKQLDFGCHYVNPLKARDELPVGRQVPVLTIGGEARNDSTPIALWLDEMFPSAPRLLPTDGIEREGLLAIDQWVSDRLIPYAFRAFPGDAGTWRRVRNAWHLSRVMANTAHSGLPLPFRIGWPWLVTRVPFVKALVAQSDAHLPLAEATAVIHAEFLDHLGAGPFLRGRDAPSLPDLAAYPQFLLYYAHGFLGSEVVLENPAILAWLRRMAPHLAGTPHLLPPHLPLRALPAAA